MKSSFFIMLLVLLSLLLSSALSAVKKSSAPVEFKDCPECPEMVVIPAGKVFIGSHEDEIGRRKLERPRILASIANPFALAKTEVTLGQFRKFMEESGYKSKAAVRDGEPLVGCNYYDGKTYGYIAQHDWKNPGYPQREDAPVVCVSWSDAMAYADWLSKKTSRQYRIPSAVEFEYASRAGSSTPWYWGVDPTKACEYANIGDRTFGVQFPKRPVFPCDDGYVYTASVGKFEPNDFGLYDMVGNAWEWTNDCFHLDISNAPVDGTSLVDNENDECVYRTPKGGSWISGISWSRAAVRSGDGEDYKSFMLGFRVAAEVER